MFLVRNGRETSTGNKHCYPHCNENPIYLFLFWELCQGLSPNFHIHVSVSDLYVYYGTRISPHISCAIPFLEVLFSKFRYWFFAVQGNGLYFMIVQHSVLVILARLNCTQVDTRLPRRLGPILGGPLPLIGYRLLSMFQFAKLR